MSFTLSSLTTRVAAEINDNTNVTFASSLTGIGWSELQQYVIDGIQDWSLYNYNKVYDTTLSTTANSWFIPLSGLAAQPRDGQWIDWVWYWQSPSSSVPLEDYEILSNSTLGNVLAFYDGYHPLWFTQDNKPVHLNYYAPWPVPSAASATISNPDWQSEIFVHYATWKALNKMSVDQRGINKDVAAEFRAKAEYRHKLYEEKKHQWTTVTLGSKS